MYKWILTLFILLLLCSGCQKQSSDETSSIVSINPTSIAVSVTPTYTVAPTHKPSASINQGEELTVELAQALLIEKEEGTPYNFTLLSDDITINEEKYFAFVATLNSIPLEPVILVNKLTARIVCMSPEGRVISYSNFPANDTTANTEYSWSGVYVRQDETNATYSTLSIIQNDSSSFEFIVYTKDSTSFSRLAGIGHIQENIASFMDENGHELVFVLTDTFITLIDDDLFSRNGLTIHGDYVFDSQDITEDYRISQEEATALLLTLTTNETKLPVDLTEYSLVIEDCTVIVQDRVCYKIGAYASMEDHDILMTTFYVSIDGNVVYVFDYISDTNYQCISLID